MEVIAGTAFGIDLSMSNTLKDNKAAVFKVFFS